MKYFYVYKRSSLCYFSAQCMCFLVISGERLMEIDLLFKTLRKLFCACVRVCVYAAYLGPSLTYWLIFWRPMGLMGTKALSWCFAEANSIWGSIMPRHFNFLNCIFFRIFFTNDFTKKKKKSAKWWGFRIICPQKNTQLVKSVNTEPWTGGSTVLWQTTFSQLFERDFSLIDCFLSDNHIQFSISDLNLLLKYHTCSKRKQLC